MDDQLVILWRRVDELEAKVARLEAAAAPPDEPRFGPEADPELRDQITQGNLIHAIKRYRELTGVGLAEAKDAVERIQRSS